MFYRFRVRRPCPRPQRRRDGRASQQDECDT
nr:MAG TPA: hypothetical protein [Caudoviricetes sp.]